MRRTARSQTASRILRLPERSPVPGLVRRVGLAVGLILLVTLLLWFQREGLRDNSHPGRGLGLVDLFYFTVVTLTTIGYGDIIPITTEARLVNALLLTPIRLFMWALFLGTAYELILEQYREKVQMRRLQATLRNHTIVCGYGVTGRSVIDELLAHGHRPEEVVVIDPDDAAAQDAAARDVIALRGDASAEAILRAAAVGRAEHVMVAPGRDDAAVLICLTVRTLAPSVRLVAAAREEENVKLLYKAGANVVVAPSVSGGRLMATAVRQEAVTPFLEDLLAFGQGVDAGERVVRPDEAGRHVADLPDLREKLVLGVSRNGERCPFHRIGRWSLEPGDVVVYLTGSDVEEPPDAGGGSPASGAASEPPE